MITINYTLPIYIRMTPEDYEIELSGECYIINSDDEHNFVLYQTLKSQYDIADFVMLADAVEYCKLKIDCVILSL
ncbi:hypothetical protein GQ597_10615 [Gilliamella sp. Pra-s65]|uniref:hypothetical protein n=1 Tax=unclassified Gilliamella TaxID=2685620 RepID=UPI001365B10B|nr:MULTISPECIES: hypothetical protein [unclassified Gilliamella]MWN91154.1 hypothetical protein [Gilliamella sp. Pra-s65]MWP74021.1 hypothetical protein [Gilliamella sp. Pra-s52]